MVLTYPSYHFRFCKNSNSCYILSVKIVIISIKVSFSLLKNLILSSKLPCSNYLIRYIKYLLTILFINSVFNTVVDVSNVNIKFSPGYDCVNLPAEIKG